MAALSNIPLVRSEILDFWLKNNLNVLFIGKAGVGKTALIESAFERAGVKARYFSASTMDPWVDFIGVPRMVEDGDKKYLELIRPKEFAEDEVEALFFDEFNRCLTGETLISLVDGRMVAIKDLVNEEYFYVYSYDIKLNKIVVGKGHSARVTQKNVKTLVVTLDNGAKIRCTPDHPFLLFDGTYRQAKDLCEGQSLMPLYRKENRNGLEKAIEWYGDFESDKNELVNIYEKIKLNHKVVSIGEGDREDVYDITVDDYHNFALAAGVFVHNSSKKIRNAVMELIQFKSINGRKFNNLRVVWAAINPYDEEGTYDVEQLDPAQSDRFQVQFELPYRPCPIFFKNKYGVINAKSALEWWNGLSADVKDKVSPRRLEYTLDMYLNGGDIKHILPNQVNSKSLLDLLTNGPIYDRIQKLFNDNDLDAAMLFIQNENNYNASINEIIKNVEFRKYYIPLLSPEKISALLTNKIVLDFVCQESGNIPIFKNVLTSVYATNNKESKRIMQVLKSMNKAVADEIIPAPQIDPKSISVASIEREHNTNNRIKKMTDYMNMFGGKTLTYEEAKNSTYIIEAFATRSQCSTMYNWRAYSKGKNQLIDFINNVFFVLANHENLGLGQGLMAKYPCPKFYYRLSSDSNLRSVIHLNPYSP